MGPAARRIGVFGGAFDPPHNAHVALVRAALSQLALDALFVFPTGQAWHKPRALSPAADRLEMARQAFSDCPAVTVDQREMLRPGPTYTIDTLTELQAEWPGAQLFLVLGGDQAAALPTWHRWRDISQVAIISIASRDEATMENTVLTPENPISSLASGRFQALRVPPMSLSATDVRQRVAAGLGIDHLVPTGVARYIDQHHLYLAP